MEHYLPGNLYRNTAGFYDYDNREIIKDDLDFYVEYANLTTGPILELASGTGRVSLYVAEKTERSLECVQTDGWQIIINTPYHSGDKAGAANQSAAPAF